MIDLHLQLLYKKHIQVIECLINQKFLILILEFTVFIELTANYILKLIHFFY
jgi:hypothetical protein